MLSVSDLPVLRCLMYVPANPLVLISSWACLVISLSKTLSPQMISFLVLLILNSMKFSPFCFKKFFYV